MQNKQNHTSHAKLFLPFDSSKGFRDYLKYKEHVVVDKKQLFSDACGVLDRKLQQTQRGQMVKVVYYDQQEYVEVKGLVSRFDPEYLHVIQTVDKAIHFRDTTEIQAENPKNISWD